ncbi:fatty acid-binding protein 1, liver-like [Rana temporaria]|uniref:fatty acid-binding protein 1, liver-like n=1 Tax=Rana temporaria TaxID=8407 RepID=UPI001AAC8A11|nr:fatty acid-binding protein 1, liver-like [Rana temporaria]
MAFTGTYELQSQENFEAFMKAVGLPEELIQKGKDVKSVTVIKQTGNHFEITVTTGPKVLHNDFNIGEETEVETPSGEKIKSTFNLEDGKLVIKLKGVTSTIEISGDLLTNVLTVKDLTYKRVSKRVS